MPKVECNNCSKLVYKRPYQLRTYKNVFCSKKCAGEYKRVGWVKCEWCSKEFRPNIPSHTHCSMKCKSEHSKAPNTICSGCGKHYFKHNSYKRKGYKRDFCSNECYGKHNRQENNPNYKGHSHRKGLHRWSLTIKELAGFKCVVCGSSEQLEAHHILSYHKFPEARKDLDNGACLCHNHHKEFHQIYGYYDFTKEDYFKFIDNYDNIK